MRIIGKLILLLCLWPVLGMAQQVTGFGSIAQNMMSPVGVASDFVNTGCILIGGSFLFASIIKYFEHRRSPLMVTMGTVVFLFVAGLLLLALPLLSYMTENGAPYTGYTVLRHV